MALPSFSFITKYFSKDDSIYKDNYDGHYHYITSKLPIPDFLRKILKLPEAKIDRRKKRFGRIRANPLYYITVPMLFIFFMVFYTAISAFEGLVQYFNTNIFLNGLIISLMLFGILKTFHNSIMLYGTAIFFRKMEKVVALDKIEKEHIYMLRRSLEKQGELVNTIYMSQTIDNIEQFGHPNFNGMRSRLIKSKLGFRTGKNKSNVNFIAGILVMLGLLGTFLGLLGTIDAVGEALDSMSNMGGDGGEVGMEEMSGFIGSLAAPLQGMGLAFSSSLFGLSGSLLIGFFLHLAGTPQNEFIENVSRWIDDREIKFDPNVKKGSGAKVPPNDDDLKEWLSGFIHMSVRTNKQISQLSDNILLSSNETKRAWGEVKGLNQAQATLNGSVQSMSENVRAIRDQGHAVATSVPSLAQAVQKSQETMGQKVDYISAGTSSVSDHLIENNKLLRHYMTISQKESDAYKASIGDIKTLIAQSNQILTDLTKANIENTDKETLAVLKQSMLNLDKRQTEVLIETRDLLKRLQKDPHMQQAQSLVSDLNNVLKELNTKTKGFFAKKD